MVLWELSLATAYFLGLKRTYKLALKIQRRLISPNYPNIRQFLHRRTRSIFDIALKVHRNIQERDIELGRNLGNRLLRWLDKMKPSANIRGATEHEEKLPQPNASTKNQPTSKSNNNQRGGQGGIQRFSTMRFGFSSARNTQSKHFPKVSVGSTTQHRQLSIPRMGFEGVIRKDIMLWMQQN